MPLSLGLGLGLTSRGPSGLRPPAGYQFVTDTDGAYLVDTDGAYIVEAIP